MRGQKKIFDDREIAAIRESYENGGRLMEVAATHQTSSQRIREVLEGLGVHLRTRSEIIGKRNHENRASIDETELRRLLDESKLSIHEIALRLGVTEPTLSMRMRQLGLKSVKGRGSPLAKNHFWKGGRCLDDDGYVLVKSPDHPNRTADGYVREHRLVMEKFLGRYLDPREVVHHRDSDQANNSPGNLQLFASNADHLRFELAGRTPNYSPDGLQRMRENALRVNRRRALTIRSASENDALPSLSPSVHCAA